MKKILFLLASLSVVAMLAGCDGKDTVPDSGAGTDEGQGTEDPEVPEEPSTAEYAVGDYYDEGFVKGIVFNVDEAGEHGYVMSLDETVAVWSYKNESVMDGTPSSDGKYNTGCVQLMSDWQEYYPGFAWAEQKNVMGLDNWYVPSSYEMTLIYTAYTGHEPGISETAEDADAKEWFNACITAHGGTPLRDVLYWTSGELGPQIAYVFDMTTGTNNLTQSLVYKSNEYPFRAISRF